jgi:tetratricopeptide (TPR) repeat protein
MTAGAWDAPDSEQVARLIGQVFDPGNQDAAIVRERALTVRAVLDGLSPGDPARAMYLTELGAWLERLFELTGDDAVLAETLTLLREGAAAAGPNHPERWFPLSQLGLALRRQFERTGRIEPLREAVERLRDAVSATPESTQVTARGDSLASLGAALRDLYRLTGEEALLGEAVAAARAALAADPPASPDHAARLINLGVTLTDLFGASRDPAVAAEGADVLRQSLSATSRENPAHGEVQAQLGRLLTMQAGDSVIGWQSLRLRNDAVNASRAALIDTSPTNHAYGNRLLGFALSLEELLRLAPRGSLLDGQITVLRRAIAAIPVAQPEHGTALYLLAEALRRKRLTHWRLPGGLPRRRPPRTRAGRARAAALHADELSLYERAAGLTTAYPYARLLACLRLMEPETAVAPQRMLAAAHEMAGLMPLLVRRELLRSDRERGLSELAPLAGEIAAAAVSAGRPDRAVELLEQVRGLLVADLVEARSSDLARLRAAAPALAAEFSAVWSRLGALDPAGAPGGYEFAGGLWSVPAADAAVVREADLKLADERRRGYQAWDDLLGRIRATDGFDGFFRAPDIGQLSAQARGGPIVFPYTSSARCGALILTNDAVHPVREVRLPSLSDNLARDQHARLAEAVRAATGGGADGETRAVAEEQINAVLAWLWDAVAGPVLDALGFDGGFVPDDSGIAGPSGAWAGALPRIWWCPVGVLALLPLHVAGHHAATSAAGRPVARTVLDRAVSSYIPTVRSLAYARAHGAERGLGPALVVAVPDAQGAGPLPGVRAEAAVVARLLEGATVLAHPTRDSVRAALPGYPVAHFGCHAQTEPDAPSASRLVLYGDAATPLTVADVSSAQLTASIAYLSACETAATSPKLADESLHITGAFALAGYQHVVGTLWPVNDVAARRTARDFYECLTADGELDAAGAARALHRATWLLRRRFPAHPSMWSAHTHTGP